MSDILVMQGGAIKALGKSTFEGKTIGKLGGKLCRFTTPDQADSYGDVFDIKTDFGLAVGETMKSPVYFHHALDPKISAMKLGMGTLTMGTDGVDIEAEIDLSNPVAAEKYEAAVKGLLGWSSGTAAHLVKREQIAVKNGKPINHVLTWPLGLDASLTPTPAERRNVAVALKSLEDEITESEKNAPNIAWLQSELKTAQDELNKIRMAAMRREQMAFIAQLSDLKK